MAETPKYLIVGMDGFRPEMMSAALTPHLWALGRAGTEYRNHRCVFPSETYVNLPALVTGTPASGHGIVANYFLDPNIDARQRWEGTRIDHVEAGMRAYAGALFTAPTLGEILGAAGRRLVVISCNSDGSARLKHPAVARFPSHLCLSVNGWRNGLPRDRVGRLVERLGEPEVMAPGETGEATQTYATDALLALIEEDGLPEVSILWYGEPDHSYHEFGIGAPESRRVIAHVDRELGRLLAALETHPERDRLNVLVTSDHAHITQTRRVDIAALIAEAGITVGDHLQDGADVALVAGYCANLHVRDGDPRVIGRLCHALMERPETGLLFTRGRSQAAGQVEGHVAGTFARALVGAEHARSPDIYLVLRTDDGPDHLGLDGTCLYDNDLKAGAGIHGGLHRRELNNLLIARGPDFAAGHVEVRHSAIHEIAPTILARLGLAPGPLGGLSGTPARHPEAGGAARATIVESGRGAYRQRLELTTYGAAAYLDHASRV